MSIVSSYISSRAPLFRINVQASTLMDHILAIVAGLGVRIVFDVVGYEDHRLTGSLVGLWEGVVMQHFIKKSPKSFDPYVAYGVRVFIDFLFTESLVRLVLTFLFTGMGIVFADIAPRVWADTGLRRSWRHLRRDLYTLLHSVPSIPDFTRPRTVRFSPSQAPSVITSVPPSPSVVTITTQAPIVPRSRKRPVPGSFPDYVSETDTDLSIRSPGSGYSTLTGHIPDRRPTIQTESETSYDPDEGNRSSSGSRTPTPTEADLPNLPNIDDEDLAREVVLEEHKDENTPRPPPIRLPPTPSDTTYAVHLNGDEVPPPSAGLQQIPDDDDWENTDRREAQATLLMDKSTSPLLVDTKLFASPVGQHAPASSTPPAVKAQPADLASGDIRQPEVIELDPHAEQPHTPADEARATISSNTNALPVTNNEGGFDLLDKLSNPVAQTSDSRPPSYAQFDLSGSSFPATSLWGTSMPAAGSGGNMDIWGLVKDRQGGAEAGSNGFDVGGGTVNLSDQPEEQDDVQHDESALEERGEQQNSNTTPEADVSSPAPEIKDPSTDVSASQSDNAGSGPSATQQEGQNPASFTPRSETETSQPVKDADPASNEPTGAESSNTQKHDGILTGGELATEPSSSTVIQATDDDGKATPTADENRRAVTLTAPVIDEELFPEDSSDRLDKALGLRKQIVQIEKDILPLEANLVLSAIPTSEDPFLAQIKEKKSKLNALNAKAERWYAIASGEDKEASADVDLSETPVDTFIGPAQDAITLCLLKNIPSITISIGSVKKPNGTKRKTALTARLDELDLPSRTYTIGQREMTVKLPTSDA